MCIGICLSRVPPTFTVVALYIKVKFYEALHNSQAQRSPDTCLSLTIEAWGPAALAPGICETMRNYWFRLAGLSCSSPPPLGDMCASAHLHFFPECGRRRTSLRIPARSCAPPPDTASTCLLPLLLLTPAQSAFHPSIRRGSDRLGERLTGNGKARFRCPLHLSVLSLTIFDACYGISALTHSCVIACDACTLAHRAQGQRKRQRHKRRQTQKQTQTQTPDTRHARMRTFSDRGVAALLVVTEANKEDRAQYDAARNHDARLIQDVRVAGHLPSVGHLCTLRREHHVRMCHASSFLFQ